MGVLDSALWGAGAQVRCVMGALLGRRLDALWGAGDGALLCGFILGKYLLEEKVQLK